MKIVHVLSPVRFGGGESLLITLLKESKKYGDEHIVILWFHSKEFEKKLSELEIDFINITPFSLGDGTNRIKISGLAILSFLWIPKFLLLIKNKYDIIHSHSFPSNLIIPLAKKLNILTLPTLITRHSVSKNYSFFQKFIFSWMFRNFNLITTVSLTVKNSLMQFTEISTKTIVIPNCVDSSFFNQKIPLTQKNKRKIFIQIARFSPIKNHKLVIESIVKLSHQDREKVSIWFAGEGQIKTELEHIANDYGLIEDGSIKFLGFVPHAMLPNLMKEVDFGLFPSDNEGFGIGAAECMASGLPVLCLDNELMREVVGSSGILVEKKKLKEGFMQMLMHGDQLRKSAIEKAESYHPSIIYTQYREAYTSLIESQKEKK